MYLKRYAIALPVFCAIDMVWIGLVANDFYRQHLGHLMRTDILAAPALAFYLLFVVGLVVFAIAPALEQKSWRHALLRGGLFGFISYATYDLTNYATLNNWPLLVTVVDLVWGATLAASVCTASYFIARKLKW